MLEFLRIFGIFIAVASFALAVFVFFRLNVPSAIAYFSGNANKRLKEYQKIQKDYHKGTANKVLPKANHNDSTGTLTNADVGTDTATLTDVSGTATMTETDGEFANALYFAQSTTTLLDEN
jgi:hypothetical protein